MNDVHINGLGVFLPGEPVPNDNMEEYLGYVFGKPSRFKKIVLKKSQIKKRYYALDRQGRSLYSSSGMRRRQFKPL
jgi:3-oxoacyl-[acyl-carrier-protein] synthase III